MVNNSGSKLTELLKLKRACEILNVHPNTLRAWDKKGILKAVRIGEKRIRRYRKEDIENFINKKK
jgi:excisionase family DNA binding protein